MTPVGAAVGVVVFCLAKGMLLTVISSHKFLDALMLFYSVELRNHYCNRQNLCC